MLCFNFDPKEPLLMPGSLWVSRFIHSLTSHLRLPVTLPAGYFRDVEGCLLGTGAGSINESTYWMQMNSHYTAKLLVTSSLVLIQTRDCSSWMQAALLYSSDGTTNSFYVRPEQGRFLAREESTSPWYFEHIYIYTPIEKSRINISLPFDAFCQELSTVPGVSAVLQACRSSAWQQDCADDWRIFHLPGMEQRAVKAGRLWLKLCLPVSLMRKTW